MTNEKKPWFFTHEELQAFSEKITKEVVGEDKLNSSVPKSSSTYAVLCKSAIDSSRGAHSSSKPELRFETRNLRNIKPEDVQIKVYFGGLNFSDVYKFDGRFLEYTPLPLVLGMECSGKVEAVGSSVEDIKVGDFVVCYCSEGGLFGTKIVIPRNLCYKIKEDQLFISCLLPTAYMTADLALHKIGKLQKGMSVLFNGVSGSVGLAAADLVNNANGRMYGVCSERKIATLKSIGKMHRVFSYEQLEEGLFYEEPSGVDIVLDTHGGRAIQRCMKYLKPFGTLVILGAAGVVSSSKEDERSWLEAGKSIETLNLIMRNISIGGAHLGMVLKLDPTHFKNSMDQIFEKLFLGEIKPILQGVCAFSEIESALKLLLERKNIGKVVVKFT